MTQKTLPKVGDIIKISRSVERPNGERVHPSWIRESVCQSRFKDLEGNPMPCWCYGSNRMLVEREMLVQQVIGYADNSIEAHGVMLDNGEKWHTMLEAPHGDACY